MGGRGSDFDRGISGSNLINVTSRMSVTGQYQSLELQLGPRKK